MDFDAFISHAKEDKSIADGIVAHLESAGLRCWIAPCNIEIGSNWPLEITNGIKRSRVVVVIYSRASDASRFVQAEVCLAFDEKLPILPLRIEVVASKGLELFLKNSQWFDATIYASPEQYGDKLAVTLKGILEGSIPVVNASVVDVNEVGKTGRMSSGSGPAIAAIPSVKSSIAEQFPREYDIIDKPSLVRRELPVSIDDLLDERGANNDEVWPGVVELAKKVRDGLKEPILSSRTLDLAGELQVALDREIGQQLAVVMTHPRFVNLFSGWHGIRHIIEQYDAESTIVEVQMADCNPSDLANDLRDETRISKSWLFKRLYELRLDLRGGKPLGIMVSGLEFGGEAHCSASHVPSPQWPNDECGGLSVLRRIAAVAEASLCPFIASACPLLLGQPDFSFVPNESGIQIASEPPLGAAPGSMTIAEAWDQLRKLPETRFVGLVAPRIVLGKPLAQREGYREWFHWPARSINPLELEIVKLARKPFLGSGAYALAAIVIRSVVQTGWPCDIQGVFANGDGDKGEFANGNGDIREAGGLLGLRGDSFATDPEATCVRAPIEVTLTGEQERRLTQLGLIVLSRVLHTSRAAFYTLRMVHQPVFGTDADANSTQELHSILPYLLSGARFAQFGKHHAVHKHGSFDSREQVQAELENLLNPYKGPSYPLRDAQVDVIERGNGVYECNIALSPRLSAEDVDVAGMISFRLTVADKPPLAVTPD